MLNEILKKVWLTEADIKFIKKHIHEVPLKDLKRLGFVPDESEETDEVVDEEEKPKKKAKK